MSIVLKFHSTPWLESYFVLRDFSYLQLEDHLAASFDTLHLNSDFRAAFQPVSADSNNNNNDDLAKPRLQQAVYETIVCELTRMIDSLSIFN